jgi:hypothetical protein
MPDDSAKEVLDDLAGQYGQSFELLLDGADTAMRGLWMEAATTDVAAWQQAAAPLVDGIQQAAAQGAATWVDVQAAAMGVPLPAPAAAAVPVEAAPAVLGSPPLRLQTLLAQGMDYADAVAQTSNYVSRLTTTMTRTAEHAGRAHKTKQVASGIAKAVAGDDWKAAAAAEVAMNPEWAAYYKKMGFNPPGMPKAPKMLLWVRVPDARACGWCKVVADRLYTEEGVKGQWHAYCRCTWRLATPDDVVGKYAKGEWQELIGQKAKPTPAKQLADAPTAQDFYDGDVGPALPDLYDTALGPALPPLYSTPTYPGDVDLLQRAPSEQVSGGVHTKTVFQDENGDLWLFKPQDEWRTHLDAAANEIARLGGLEAPPTYMATIGGRQGSLQRMYGTKATRRDAFGSGPFDATKVSAADVEALQQQQALDWLIGNHDAHSMQFVRVGYASQGAPIIGIDKGQAFKFAGTDELNWKYHPNKVHGAPEPVYNLLAKAHIEQGTPLPLLNLKGKGKHADAMEATIGRLQAIPDAQYRAILRPYAEAAAAKRSLAVGSTFANDVEAFLDHAVQRKADLLDDLTAYHKNVHRAQGRLLRKNRKDTAAPPTVAAGLGGPQGFERRYADAGQAARALDVGDAKHHAAAKVYTGGDYSGINGALRTKGSLTAEHRRTVEALDKVMAPPKEVVTVVRGTTLPYQWQADPGSLVGKVIWDEGFTSSSYSDRAAFSGPSYLHITLRPETSRAVLATPWSKYGTREREVIIDRGSHFFIHGARKDGNAWIIECEVVSPEWARQAGVLAAPPQ